MTKYRACESSISNREYYRKENEDVWDQVRNDQPYRDAEDDYTYGKCYSTDTDACSSKEGSYQLTNAPKCFRCYHERRTEFRKMPGSEDWEARDVERYKAEEAIKSRIGKKTGEKEADDDSHE